MGGVVGFVGEGAKALSLLAIWAAFLGLLAAAIVLMVPLRGLRTGIAPATSDCVALYVPPSPAEARRRRLEALVVFLRAPALVWLIGAGPSLGVWGLVQVVRWIGA